ncbi:hypothetical protein [Saccharopolyspora gloriosae]|uniref:hypothetical protein n=1 Tax=Saccharopolyspora gloriosae TaxID=455344 RepID=UPI001FB75F53|nr:hypothetical protein [Saccharopolyspora gloriosae]
MDRRELFTLLRGSGVAESELWIEGVHEPRTPPTEFLFLRKGENGWDTGVAERGVWHVITSSPDEDTACARLLRLAQP